MEANLIDRDIAEDYFGSSDWEILAKETLREVPLVDAVPVVRCRECVYKNTTACPAYDAPFMRTSLRIKFCSEGQRREADHEVSEL